MTDFTAANFEALCATPQVKDQLDTLETTRKKAVGRFWMVFGGGVVATLVLAVVLFNMWPAATFFVLIGGLIAAFFMASRPLDKAKKALKQPVLESLAQQGGMQYAETGFLPPVFANAQKVLFGGYLSDTTFTDRFNGKDEAGNEFAFYEAQLERGSGKNRQTIFSGQMYGFQRAAVGQGTTVITPDKGLFNFFKPGPGMERVKFIDDADFEKRFEVYSTNAAEAQSLLGGANVRAQLLALRAKGQLFGYIAPDEALFAITGKDRFEPGSMFKSTGGQDRARTMFDDVCASLTVLKELKGWFG